MSRQEPSLPPSISFVVLALNEEDNIATTVNTVRSAVELSGISDYEIILVNDGSTDNTAAIMDDFSADDPKIIVVHNKRNLGLGGAYKEGVRVARGEYIQIVAGDNAMPAGDICVVLDQLGKADIILPYLANGKLRPFGRRLGSATYTFLVNMLFGLKIRYYNGAVPRRHMLNQITQRTDSYAFQAELVVKLVKGGCTYHEIALFNTPSGNGHSVALQPKRLFGVYRGIRDLYREISRPGAIRELKTESSDPTR